MRTFLTAVFVLFTPFNILGQAIEIESPTLGIPNTEDGFEPDSIFYVADEINFLVMSNGLLKWGVGYSNSVKLHTEVNIDKAFFYKEEDQLMIFFPNRMQKEQQAGSLNLRRSLPTSNQAYKI